MNSLIDKLEVSVWKQPPLFWASVVALALLVGFIFFDALRELVHVWNTQEEYSYGYMIPVIALFIIWQRKDKLERLPFPGSWWGVLLVLLGFALFLIGKFSTYYHVMQYSLLIVTAGLLLSYAGRGGFKLLWMPVLFLFFMIPLPESILGELSTKLQMISSQLGVRVIRLFGISVFLEGNVIDLGVMKLQVVEACSGLRYLFPLMTLAFISAYFFKGALWKRILIFLSSIPITVLLNSFRIGMIGVTVEYWGKEMAEGFLHDFEGWAVFMACTALLVGEMWVLARIGRNRMPLSEAFVVGFPSPTPKHAQLYYRKFPRSYLIAAFIVATVAAAYTVLPERHEMPPKRKDFSTFPLELGEWKGRGDRLEQIFLDQLKLDDYILADFVNGNQHTVSFYVSYYASESKGDAVHSPRNCLPGGGWEMIGLAQVPVEGVRVGREPLWVNRAVIQMGQEKQLTYYWFMQGGRIVTNEYLVRWYIFWDALTRNRSDGALIRLITPLAPGESEQKGDARLTEFSKEAVKYLPAYVPN